MDLVKVNTQTGLEMSSKRLAKKCLHSSMDNLMPPVLIINKLLLIDSKSLISEDLYLQLCQKNK